MDQQLQEIIDSLVNQVMQNPTFANLPEDQKLPIREKVQGRLYEVILDTLVDNLTDDQVMQLQNLTPESPEMEAKVQEFAATIPNFLTILEEKLNQEVTNIQNNPLSL